MQGNVDLVDVNDDPVVENTTETDVVKITSGNMGTNTIVKVRAYIDVNSSSAFDSGEFFDEITIARVKEGTNAWTLIAENENHTFTADNSGTVSDYSGADTAFILFRGAQQFTYDTAGTGANGTYRITSKTDTGITSSINHTTGEIDTFSSMSGDTASVEVTITAYYNNTSTTFNKVLSYSKSKQGDQGEQGVPGADGADGSAGADARVVNLTADVQGVQYNIEGASPNPATVNLTATALNTEGTVYYEYFVNDVSVQNTTTATYALSSESSYSNMPKKVEVQIREDSDSGTILARDQITIYGLKAGGSGYTIILSNEAHTLSTTNAGVVNYSGSGTDIIAFEGSTQLTYDDSSPYGDSTFRVSASGSSVTPGSASTVSGNIRRFANASNMTADDASIEFTITIVNEAGSETVITKRQSLSKSIEGDTGPEGPEGPQGEPGPGVLYIGEYSDLQADNPSRILNNNGTAQDVVSDSGTYYAYIGTHGDTVTNTPGPPSSDWEAFTAFDAIATGLLIVTNSFVKSTINVGTNAEGNAANITIHGADANPYISIGQGTGAFGYGLSGIFLGRDSSDGVAKLSMVGANGSFQWDGTDLALTGDITATSGTITGTMSVGNPGSIFIAPDISSYTESLTEIYSDELNDDVSWSSGTANAKTFATTDLQSRPFDSNAYTNITFDYS